MFYPNQSNMPQVPHRGTFQSMNTRGRRPLDPGPGPEGPQGDDDALETLDRIDMKLDLILERIKHRQTAQVAEAELAATTTCEGRPKRVLVFGLGDVLHVDHAKESKFDIGGVESCLLELKDNGFGLFIASFDIEIYARLHHQHPSLMTVFDGVAAPGRNMTMMNMIKQLATNHGFNIHDVIVFEADAQNIVDCRAGGVEAVDISGEMVGVTSAIVHAAIAKFNQSPPQ